MNRSNPWQNVAALTALAALAGAGIGAASALMFSERRAGALDRELESLERRVRTLEQLADRVARLERGSPAPVPRPPSA